MAKTVQPASLDQSVQGKLSDQTATPALKKPKKVASTRILSGTVGFWNTLDGKASHTGLPDSAYG